MSRLSVALMGAGQMGSNHARVISESVVARLSVVIDPNPVAAQRLAELYGCRASSYIEDALAADAVVIAASTQARIECVTPVLQAGIPVFVEKPFALDLVTLDQMLALAAHKNTPVMCGFVERFNAAIRTAAALLDEDPVHVLCTRHSPPAPRIASSVVHDMLLHDLDLAVGLFGWQEPVLMGSACVRPPGGQHFEIADCTIGFDGKGLATLSSNRMGHRKIRAVSIYGATKLVEVDLLRQAVTVYRNVSQEMTQSGGGVGYRSSTEVDIPFVRHSGEPLALQFAHFLSLIDGAADIDIERQRIRPAHVLAQGIEDGLHVH